MKSSWLSIIFAGHVLQLSEGFLSHSTIVRNHVLRVYDSFGASCWSRGSPPVGALFAHNQSETSSESSPISNPGILIADIFGLALSSQLLGLMDVLDDPTFLANGGWFQPLPATPSTLPTLIQTLSRNTVLYLLVAVALDAYQTERISSTTATISTALKVCAGFCVLRLLLGAAVAASTALAPSELVQGLREAYFVGIFSVTARYILYSLYYK